MKSISILLMIICVCGILSLTATATSTSLDRAVLQVPRDEVRAEYCVVESSLIINKDGRTCAKVGIWQNRNTLAVVEYRVLPSVPLILPWQSPLLTPWSHEKEVELIRLL